MPPPPSHLCPKCNEPQVPEAFINKNGQAKAWCSWCREAFRSRFVKPTKSQAPKPLDTTAIAKAEGYADHPLATLLALSHIVGAQQALAIRDGKSWRGKKAWRAYYEAKRELAAALARGTHCCMLDGCLHTGKPVLPM